MSNIQIAKPVMTINEQKQLVTKLVTCIEVKKQMDEVLAKHPTNLVYDRGTRDQINHTQKYLINTLRDKRATVLRSSLKRDLVDNIRFVAQQTLVQVHNELANIMTKARKLKSPVQRAIDTERSKDIVKALEAKQNVIVKQYDFTMWNCMTLLVINGYLDKPTLDNVLADMV